MEKNHKSKYTTVHIPTVLAEIIDEIIENEECAYSSRSEFIKDAIRRFLEYYYYYPRHKRNSRTHQFCSGLSEGDIANPLTKVKDSKKQKSTHGSTIPKK